MQRLANSGEGNDTLFWSGHILSRREAEQSSQGVGVYIFVEGLSVQYNFFPPLALQAHRSQFYWPLAFFTGPEWKKRKIAQLVPNAERGAVEPGFRESVLSLLIKVKGEKLINFQVLKKSVSLI